MKPSTAAKFVVQSAGCAGVIILTPFFILYSILFIVSLINSFV